MIGRCTSRNGTDTDQPHQRGDDHRDRSIGHHGAEPRLPALAHQADRQPVLHQEQIGRADPEHDARDGGKGGSAAGPSATAPDIRARSVCRCRRCRDGRDCPTSRDGWHGCAARNRKASASARRSTRPTQSLAARWRKKAPWPQSCWIMNSRTRKPAAGTASSRHEPVIAEMNGAPHQKPQQHKRPDRDGELNDAADGIRCAVTGKDLRPAASVGYWCG